jgi:limonene-1,2-epoxide hydrolase
MRARTIVGRVVRSWLATALLLALLAGCSGSSKDSPESIVRAWSKALNAGDNQSAADLFAPGAQVIQGPVVIRLRTHADAVVWNAGLPCSGRIVAIATRGATVTATFLLGNRPTSACDGPGHRATAVFRIRGGKIVLWHQVPAAPPPPPTI